MPKFFRALTQPFELMVHPIDRTETWKLKRQYSVPAALLMVVLLFVSAAAEYSSWAGISIFISPEP